MSKTGNYIGGHTILHEGSPFFYKTNPSYLSKIHRKKNYLKEIENQLRNIKMCLARSKELKEEIKSKRKRKRMGLKNDYEERLYYWLIAIFKTLRQRHTKLRHHPEIEQSVSEILLEMGIHTRLLKRVKEKVNFTR